MKNYKLRKTKPIEERFWEKVKRSNENKCWEWNGSKNSNGYGYIGRGRKIKGKVGAHRLSWEIHFGAISKGVNVCHHCDNPSCVNPNHLFLGTQSDNIKDCQNKKRARGGSLKGGKNPNAKLSLSQVIQICNLYKQGNIFQYELAKKYNVTQAQISAIVTKKSWNL